MYFSCEWIEYKMVLDVGKLSFCCKAYGENNGFIRICDFEGGEIPIDTILNRRRELREQNNSGSDNYPCKGCPLLIESDWPALQNNAYFDQLTICHSNACNIECTYCYSVIHKEWAKSLKSYKLKPVLQDVLDKGYFIEGGRVQWACGEPTIFPGFDDLFGKFLMMGAAQTVFSNSVRFSKPLEEALKQRKASLVTSLDCGTQETYYKIKGKDYFHQVLDNIQTYSNTGGAVVVQYIINNQTSGKSDITQFIKLCKELKIRQTSITCDVNARIADNITDESLKSAALLAIELERSGIDFEVRYDDFTEKYSGKLKAFIKDNRSFRNILRSNLRKFLPT